MKKAALLLSVLVLTLSGCGNVDWFPAYHRLATTPDPFSFTTKTKVPFGSVATPATDTSEAITVSGLTADSSPISVSGPDGSNSLYTIGTGTPTATAGTVKNGDTVTVTHTVPPTPAASITSKLTIGDRVGTFTSITRNVESFAVTGTGASGSTITSAAHNLIVANASLEVSVASTGSVAAFSFNNVDFFTNATPQVFTMTNGMTIYLRSRVPSVTTVTIDGVPSTFTTTVP
jgi:hypothetical protein